MERKKIRVAIAGVGNCASSLVQGVFYYRGVEGNGELVPGLMHNSFGGYLIKDIEFVAAFDIDKRKVGKDLGAAIFEKPNCTTVFQREIPVLGVEVMKGPVLDGVAEHMKDYPEERSFRLDEKQKAVDVTAVLKEKKADVLVSYMPVGSEDAAKYYAQCCLDADCALVNCMPVFIASNPEWEKKFRDKKIPIVGDDIKSQVGATITHRVLAKLFSDRGVKITNSYQLNVGGNSVTGDQELLLEINGELKKCAIGELIDNVMLENQCIKINEKDVLALEKTSLNVNCFTIDNEFKVILAPVAKFIRHKITENLYCVEFGDGRSIKITADHNLFTLDNEGNIKNLAVRELGGESLIIAPATMKAYCEHKKDINLERYLLKLHSKTDGEYLSIHNHPNIKIPLKFPLTNSLLELVGLWLADGNYDRIGSSNIELAIGNDQECLNVLENTLNGFQISYAIKKNNVGVRVNSKTLGAIFREILDLRGDAYSKRVPEWVFGLSEEQIAAVLRGYMSGDGTVCGRQIRCTSASKTLIEDMATLFLRIGIYATYFMEQPSIGKNSFRKDGATFWHCTISSQENIKKFEEKVGFIQEYKNAKASEISNIRAFSKQFLPKIKLMTENGIMPATTYKLNRIEKRIVLSQLHKVSDHLIKARLNQICSEDIKFLKVKKITKLPAKEQFVYDLSVEPFERFICSNILIHNTDFLNMREYERLKSKKISKTEAVQSQLPVSLSWDHLHIGPSDYVPFLNDNKVAFIRLEGKKFGDIPINLEMRLSVEDSPNSAGIVIDALRAAKLAKDRGIGGALISPSSYFMKHPPQQFPDSVAKEMVEDFMKGERER